ncbi:MAG: exodeoxyribonuclease V subunit alpha, partial [Proteobacteria bacterium SW_6_67_9]
ERRLAERVRALLDAAPEPVDTATLGPQGGLFAYDWTPAGATNWQAVAAFTAQRHRFAVISGGPGTGKTYTIVRLMIRLVEAARAAGERPPVIRLAAPTGKAATRLQQAVVEQAPALATAPEVRGWLAQASASTLHRLLGGQPGRRSRFRHHHGNRLPHDAVIVDETSMVSLSLMARLVEAVRPAARLV